MIIAITKTKAATPIPNITSGPRVGMSIPGDVVVEVTVVIPDVDVVVDVVGDAVVGVIDSRTVT